MKTASFQQILTIVQKTNILPLTSYCNIKCEFCSHKNNPEDIDVYKVPQLTGQQVEELIEYLSPNKKIVIGESASKIIEGEPFLFKGFFDVLKQIRHKHKKTSIQITTNGTFLTEDTVSKLAKVENLEINLSLNSSSTVNRKRLVKDSNPSIAIQSCKLLNQHGIKYYGSMVIMPHITGWDDTAGTIAYLCKNDAEVVRVFIPGYTKYSKVKFDFEDLYNQASAVISQLRKKYDTPIVIEPPLINSLEAHIEGAIKDSPAYNAGLSYGDTITRINGKEVISRVDAYNQAYKYKNPNIEFYRNYTKYIVQLEKEKNESTGFVVNYDIDPKLIQLVERLIKSNHKKKPLIVTSELGYNVLSLITKGAEILPIKNNYFGGSIRATGLLTTDDIYNGVRDYLNENESDLIILPSDFMDYAGRDLRGVHYLDLQEKTGIEVQVI